eukprot:TRINITY_DN5125_c2_g2_i1.p7 TRINITY_DN5125_c2_g2~~TRINITY_DN5125_c2_g2_i1.p7  ORF type:complete len:114 (-),score=4.60 TRINITY_DN5125_c2_g2_i1:751-1092(-)
MNQLAKNLEDLYFTSKQTCQTCWDKKADNYEKCKNLKSNRIETSSINKMMQQNKCFHANASKHVQYVLCAFCTYTPKTLIKLTQKRGFFSRNFFSGKLNKNMPSEQTIDVETK